MKSIKQILAALLLTAFAAIGVAWAAGLYTNGMPQQSSTGWSGTELVPVDTQYAGGRAPQTIAAPVTQLQGLVPNTLTDAATITPSGVYSLFTVTLGGNRTIANLSPAPIPNSTFKIMVYQDLTGSRTVTWGSNFKWVGGSAPTLTTTVSHADLITCLVYSYASNRYVCDKQLDIVP